MDSNSPLIDPAEIMIEINKLDVPDYRLDCEIPARFVKRIHKKLKKRGENYGDKKMVEFLSKICIDEGIRRLGEKSIWSPEQPENAKQPTFSTTRPFRISVIIDVMPKIDLPDFSSIEIERSVFEESEESVDSELHEQCLEAGTPHPYDGELEYGDEIKCTFAITIVGKEKPLIKQEDCHIRVPAPRMPVIACGMIIPDLSDILQGHQCGDTITLDTEVPESFPHPFHRGRPAQLTITINETSRITPASVEEIVTQYGSHNELILRKQIRMSLRTRTDRSRNQSMSTQLLNKIHDKIEVSIPERIIKSRLKQRIDFITKSMQDSELSEEEIAEELSQRSDHILQDVKHNLKHSAILVILQRALDIKVGEDDVQEQIRIIAEARRQRPEVIREEAMGKNQMDRFYGPSLERKISEQLLKKVQIKDITLSTEEP